MAGLLKKCKDFLGFDTDYEDEEDFETSGSDNEEEETVKDEAKKSSYFDSHEQPAQDFDYSKSRKMSQKKFERNGDKVVNLANKDSLKVVLCNPTEFDNCPNICGHLREQMTIVLNLEFVQSPAERKRIFDFVSGCCFALDCNIQKVSELIYVVAPYNVDLLSEMDMDKVESFEPDFSFRASL